MTAGKRNRRIVIERFQVTGQDDYGADIQDWDNYAAAMAEVLFGTGQERRQAAQEGGQQTATFIVQWSPTLADTQLTDRIQAVGAVWDIASVAPVGLNESIHITAARSN